MASEATTTPDLYAQYNDETNGRAGKPTTHQRAIRPKLLKLTTDDDLTAEFGHHTGVRSTEAGIINSGTNTTGSRGRKKNKSKPKDSSRERYADDPAYTEDVRHLAFPQRRNSGPESARRKSCSILQGRFMDINSSGGCGNQTDDVRQSEQKLKKRKTHKQEDKFNTATFVDDSKEDPKWRKQRCKEYQHSSSSDDSDYDRRGQSLDRSSTKQNKKTLCFKRDRESKTPEFRKEGRYLPKKAGSYADSYVEDTAPNYGTYDSGSRSSRSRNRNSDNQEPPNYRRPTDLPIELDEFVPNPYTPETKPSGRFQIGKRLLKGEIGIKSFNYYLLKEGLKSNKKTSQSKAGGAITKPVGLSKSEENIYEEIYFVDRRSSRKPSALNQPTQSTQQQQQPSPRLYPDCELCNLECTNKNCDICKANERAGLGATSRLIGNAYVGPTTKSVGGGRGNIALNRNQSAGHTLSTYAPTIGMGTGTAGGTENQSSAAAAAAAAAAAEHSRQQHVLQYQSYNPNNPGVFKIETTPVAFTSDYNPIHHALPADQQQQQLYASGQHHYSGHPDSAASHHLSQHHNISKSHKQQSHHQPTSMLSSQTHAQPHPHYDTNVCTKSSSSSDSLHHQKYSKQTMNRHHSNNNNNQSDYPTPDEYHGHYQQAPLPQPPSIPSIPNTQPQRHNLQHEMQPKFHSSQYHGAPIPPHHLTSSGQQQQQSAHQLEMMNTAKIYKTDSRTSIMSENMSVKSENSGGYRAGGGGAGLYHHRGADMSDSSIGDSLFSYSAQRRYFGSAESCRFGFECRRCSYDGEKCSFSDNCRYDCRNCDCSSSYFSSDFDEANQFSRQNSARMSASVPPTHLGGSSTSSSGVRDHQYQHPNPHQRHNTSPATASDSMDMNTPRYAEDFIKHITNVKQNAIYQVEDTKPVSNRNQPIIKASESTNSAQSDANSIQRKTNAPKTASAATAQSANQCPDYATVASKKMTPHVHEHRTIPDQSDGIINRTPSDVGAITKTKSSPAANNKMPTSIQKTTTSTFTTGAIPKTSRPISNQHLGTPPRQRSVTPRTNSPKKSSSTSATPPHQTTQTADHQQPHSTAISSTKSKSSPILHIHRNPDANLHPNINNNINALVTKQPSAPPMSQAGGAHRTHSIVQSQPLLQAATRERSITKTQFNARKALPALPAVATSSPPSSPSLPPSLRPPTAMPRTMFDKYAPKTDSTVASASIPTTITTSSAAEAPPNNPRPTTTGCSIGNNQRVASSSPRKQATTMELTMKGPRYRDGDGGVSVDDDDDVGGGRHCFEADVDADDDDDDEESDNDEMDDNEDDVFIKDSTGAGDARPRRRRKVKRHTTGIASSRQASSGTLYKLNHPVQKQVPPQQQPQCVPKHQLAPRVDGPGPKGAVAIPSFNPKQSDSPAKSMSRDERESDGFQGKNIPSECDVAATKALPRAERKGCDQNENAKRETDLELPQKAPEVPSSNSLLEAAANTSDTENIINQNNRLQRANDVVFPIGPKPIESNPTTTFTTHTSTVVLDGNLNDGVEEPICDGDPSISSSVGFAPTTNTTTTTTTTTITATDHRNSSSSSSPVTQPTLRQQSQPDSAFSVATEVAGDASSHSESNANVPRYPPYRPIASSTPDLLSIAITQELVQQLGDLRFGTPVAQHYESNESLPTSTATTATNATSTAFDSCDILDLPLPAIPVKRRDRKTAPSERKHSLALVAPKEYSSLPTSYKSSHRRSLSHQPLFTSNHQTPLNNGAQLRAQRSGIFGDIANYRVAAHLSESRELVSADETMHYHSSQEKPKYLFGDRSQHHHPPLGAGSGASSRNDQIYLNKSGWVQVNQRSFEKSPNRTNEQRRFEYTKGLSQFGADSSNRAFKYDDIPSYANKNPVRPTNQLLRTELNRQAYFRNSKIEELLNRSEARRSSVPHKINYNIDPQISAILNERPGFLPVKRLTDNESPPPITPIISPPPAFQDSKAKPKPIPPVTAYHLTVNNHDPRRQPPKIPSPQPPSYSPLSPPLPQSYPAQHIPGKGMVFSRSFEYDNRKNRDYKENFSKSFDYDLSNNQPTSATVTLQPDKLRTKMFTNLTGVSPNYLTKKETSTRGSRSSSREPSPVYQTPNEETKYVEPFRPKTRVRNTLSVRPDKFMSLDEQQGRSRRAQFSRLHNESSSSSGSQGFRSLDQSVANTVSRRLNSCDSGARSDLSNDEVDEDPRVNQKRSKFLKTQSHHDIVTKQRSLTPDKSADEQQPLLRRSLTPEKFGTAKNSSDGSQTSLFVKHHSSGSGSRSSTLERPHFDEKLLVSSRSSSSSSYSGGDHEAPGYRRVSQRRTNAENRIRRSRSLQLTERSPNRTPLNQQQQHKLVVRLTGNAPQSNEQLRPARSPSMQYTARYPSNQTTQNEHINHQTKDFRNHDNDKSKSFDSDYGHHPPYPSYNFKADFDKSRSFDDDYGNSNRLGVKPVADSRSFSNDRMYQKNTGPNGAKSSSSSSSQKQHSPHSYGSRLYEHEMMYDLARKAMDRSPIMEFRRQKRNPNNRSRERSPNNSKKHDSQPPTNLYRDVNHRSVDQSISQRRDLSPSGGSAFAQHHHGSSSNFLSASNSHSSPGSDYDNHDMSKEQRREAELVTDFLYGHKNGRAVDPSGGGGNVHPPRRKESNAKNAAANPTTASPSPGSSCTARSCDYWPNCGNSTVHRSNSGRRLRQIKTDRSGGGIPSVYSVGRPVDIRSPCDEIRAVREVEDEELHLYDDVNSESPSDVDARSDRFISESVPNLSEYHNDTESPYGNRSGHSVFRGIPPSISPQVAQSSSVVQNAVVNRSASNVRVSSSPDNRKKEHGIRGVTHRKPPMYERSRSSSVQFLMGEREMPITRDRYSRSPKRNKKAISLDEPTGIIPEDVSVRLETRRTRGNNKLRLPTNNDLPMRWASNEPTKVRSPVFQAVLVSPIKRQIQRERFRSRSLPNTFLRNGSFASKGGRTVGPSESDSIGRGAVAAGTRSSDDAFSTKLSLQMRAVSSPSLSENLHDSMSNRADASHQNQHQRPDIDLQKMATNRTSAAPSHGAESTNGNDLPTNGSVLQKLRNTFSHLKNKSSTAAVPLAHPTSLPVLINNNQQSSGPNSIIKESGSNISTASIPAPKSTGNSTLNVSSDYSTTYRFGPLVWRTSKERRKTKHQRRDKCNSGDSGIQVELDNEDMLPGPESLEATAATTTTAGTTVNVRRANSAKVQSSSSTAATESTRAKLIRKSSDRSSLPLRSLSQPSGLDRLSKEPENNNSESDSEDFSIHRPPLPPPVDHPIFAEVLYTFQPASDQELALEKGALVEVIKRDPGPWWWGRIKPDTVMELRTPVEAAPLEGWFPKDFVRLIVPMFPASHGDVPVFSPSKESPHPQTRPRHPPYVEARNCDISYPQKGHQSPMSFKRAASQSPSNVSPRTSTGAQCSEAIRTSVMRELLETEINYVKLLTSICTGFLEEMRQRPDIFPEESIMLIFSNIEQIWQFQQTFLVALRSGIAADRVAETFLEYQSGFMVYSVYCNTYSRALMELETYNGKPVAAAILESCRVSQNLPELPLSAHLLAPIQRICRYPLHLSELVKHTTTTTETATKRPSKLAQRQHFVLDDPNEQLVDDEVDVAVDVDGNNEECVDGPLLCGAQDGDSKDALEVALSAMKHVTEMVNEGKRHSEYLSRIQARFDSFQGPSISVHSTRLFLQTDAIRMTPNLWNNTYTLFLFDSQLIYCKKDLLKRTTYTYKGRIFLDNCRILNLPDGKIFGLTLKNALRIYCDTRSKWFDFCFRSGSSKLRFLNTLSAERKFSGHHLFVSELAGVDDDDMSDRDPSGGNADQLEMAMSMTTEDGGTVRLIERAVDVENMNPQQDNGKDSTESQTTTGKYKKSDTLPKKSRKLQKEPTVTSYEYHSNSLGRKKIGNWFRKAKSTNTTPSQSPTHHRAVSVSATSVDESHTHAAPLSVTQSAANPIGQAPLANESRPMDTGPAPVTPDTSSP